MKIGIITAMPGEFLAVARSLEPGTVMQIAGLKALSCRTAGHNFTVLESGIGFDNAARAAESVIRESRPALLISAGFCGGIDPELKAGDAVVAKNLIIASHSSFDEIPVELSGLGRTFAARQAAEGKRVFAGTFVSTSIITSKSCLAAMLPSHYPNQVVEMESGAIAIIAAENNIPLLAIRTVSDTAAEELGFSLDEFCDPDMCRILPYKVLLTTLRKPRIAPQLVRLAFSSHRAAASLTATLSRLFSAFQDTSCR